MYSPDTIPKPESPDPATAGGDRRPSSCYAEALQALAAMSREEGILALQAGLAKDPLARLTHSQNEIALAYAHLRLARHNDEASRRARKT
jgi:hypothetical protein